MLKVLNSGSFSAAENELMLLLFVSCCMAVHGSLYGSFQLLLGCPWLMDNSNFELSDSEFPEYCW